jgi:hypothetical protein
MRKFIGSLFSNRFGIILATLNVCYFVSRTYFQRVLEHTHGESCFVFKNFFLFPVNNDINGLMLFQNLPAIILTLFPNFLMREFSSNLCVFTQTKFQMIFFSFFMILQWLFIGWLAKTIAGKLQGFNQRNN